MIYLRGHSSDFDDWAERGATGWTYANVLPYFKRSEHNERIRDDYHGHGGPLNVADPTWTSTLTEPFVESAEAVGIRRNDDFNGAEHDGVGPLQLTQKRGRRWSAADAFLHPIRKKRENLTVVTRAHAHRVLIDGERAVGVEFHQDGAVRSARAEREVIVAAGAYNSPQLLMLSGIGPADHLREAGVAVAVDSPHVGQHLQDHAMATVTYECKDAATLLDATHPKHLLHYVASRGKGKLSSNVAEAAAHVRVQDGATSPDFQLLMGAAYYFDNGYRSYPNPAFTIAPCFLRPRSEGSVRLRSGDPHDAPAIHLNFLSEPEEVKANVDAVRLARAIAESGPLGRVAVRNIDPGPGVASDAQIEAWLRAELQHEYHASCTCRIGREGEGVLDSRLRVRGVDSLRVVDASAMPRVVSANTNAATIMLAERASDLILGRKPLAAAAAGAEAQQAAA
jgi:choline dehydrogenase